MSSASVELTTNPLSAKLGDAVEGSAAEASKGWFRKRGTAMESSAMLATSRMSTMSGVSKKESLGIVHFAEDSHEALKAIMKMVSKAIGEDFFTAQRYCDLLNYERSDSLTMSTEDPQPVGENQAERLLQFARQCIVDCHNGNDLKVALCPDSAKYTSVRIAQKICHSNAIRLGLVFLLAAYDLNDSDSWRYGISYLQVILIPTYTLLNCYQRGGITKFVHQVEVAAIVAVVILWIIYFSIDVHYLRLVFPVIAMVWSRTLRDMAGNSARTFVSCIPTLVFLLGVVTFLGCFGMIVLSIQGIEVYKYDDDEIKGDTYSDVDTSFLATFIILTSENWPSVLLVPYKHSAWNSLWMIPTVAFLNQLCLAIILGMVWTNWETNYRRQVCRHYSVELRSYALAWLSMVHLEQLDSNKTQLSNQGEDGLSHKVWQKLVHSIGQNSPWHYYINDVYKNEEMLEDDSKQGSTTDEIRKKSQKTYADVTLNFRDDDTDQIVDLWEFFSLCELLKFQVMHKPCWERDQDSVHVAQFRRIFGSKHAVSFQIIWSYLIIPLSLVVYSLGSGLLTKPYWLDDSKNSSELWLHAFMIPIEVISTLEVTALVCAAGVAKSLNSGHRMCDVVSFLFMITGWIIYIFNRSDHRLQISCIAPWMLAHGIRFHIGLDPAMWDIPGSIPYILSDIILINSRHDDGIEKRPTSFRESFRLPDPSHPMIASRNELPIDDRARHVEDELANRTDSLRSRVHLINRRVKEGLARTFFLLLWSVALISLLLYFYAALGHIVFKDTIEQVNAEFAQNSVDTDVNTFRTFSGSLLICFQFVIAPTQSVYETTDNNWNDVMYTLKAKYAFFGPFYCVSFFMVTNFIMLNIVTSIVLASFEKVDEFQLVDQLHTTASVDYKNQEYVIYQHKPTWHGLDLRITLLKENKADLLQTYLKDLSFKWIVDKTFTRELCAKIEAAAGEMEDITEELPFEEEVPRMGSPRTAQMERNISGAPDGNDVLGDDLKETWSDAENPGPDIVKSTPDVAQMRGSFTERALKRTNAQQARSKNDINTRVVSM